MGPLSWRITNVYLPGAASRRAGLSLNTRHQASGVVGASSQKGKGSVRVGRGDIFLQGKTECWVLVVVLSRRVHEIHLQFWESTTWGEARRGWTNRMDASSRRRPPSDHFIWLPPYSVVDREIAPRFPVSREQSIDFSSNHERRLQELWGAGIILV